MWAITKFWNGGGDWRGRACRCLSSIGASSSPHGCTAVVWSVPGCGWAGGCGYWCWSKYESELGEDDGWLLPLLDVLASSISRRRSYTSTTFFLFMVDRWSMPLLLQRERVAQWEVRAVTDEDDTQHDRCCCCCCNFWLATEVKNETMARVLTKLKHLCHLTACDTTYAHSGGINKCIYIFLWGQNLA